MNSDALVVLCRKCRQKIALPMGFDSPVFLCPRCETSMQTPPEIMLPPPAHAEEPVAETLRPSPPKPSKQKVPEPESFLEIPPEPLPEQSVTSIAENPFVAELPDVTESHENELPDLQDVQPTIADEVPASKSQNLTAAPDHAVTSAALNIPAEEIQAASPAPIVTERPPDKASVGGKKSYASAYAAKGGRDAEKPHATSPASSGSSKRPPAKNIRRELVEQVGESALVGMIKEFCENEVSAQPMSRPDFLKKLMKKGLAAEVATEIISYAQNSPEGKEIALGTSWTTFYLGLAALVGGALLNIITVAATGYIVKYFVIVPMLGFLAVVNSGQKILVVSFPMFSKTSVQALIFLAFLLIGGTVFYFAILR